MARTPASNNRYATVIFDNFSNGPPEALERTNHGDLSGGGGTKLIIEEMLSDLLGSSNSRAARSAGGHRRTAFATDGVAGNRDKRCPGL